MFGESYSARTGNIASYDNPSLTHYRIVTNVNCCSDSLGTEYTWGTTISPNPNIAGFFEWSFNGIDYRYGVNTNNQNPLVTTFIGGQINDINGGNPNHDYYDIDLTINDRGVNGGTYSQLNYNAPNPNNSKAFIFDLDMPTDLFPTQSVDIKAKGYHKN